MIQSFKLKSSVKIIDLGSGDSKTYELPARHLCSAMEKVKRRLGNNSTKVNWILSDITEFKPQTKYDVW